MDLHFHGDDRDSQRLRDLLVRQSLHRAQPERGPVHFGHLFEPLQPSLELRGGLGQLRRTRSGIGQCPLHVHVAA